MLFACLMSHTARAALPEYTLILKNHLFYPQVVDVPAGKKVRLVIENQDAEPEEFDSFDLNREKVLFPGRRTVIYVGPLEPGIYDFFGEFHPNQAKGQIRAVTEGQPDVD
ncbi:cupredoxin domain-containing protein [Lacimicrobium sp. SS2-24]|uniref:cupredoxin domain-containing protein n=1 Tax=Lacimicrobium sp. SS2-24 TaxID=2005569 RepID=UPI000B4AA57B|nr:cupredoxin domain-containing protein [Lacimicrobium sp. SS2-24]